MIDDFPPSGSRRFLQTAITVFVACLLLYGAALLLKAVWVWLVIGFTIYGLTKLGWWLWVHRDEL